MALEDTREGRSLLRAFRGHDDSLARLRAAMEAEADATPAVAACGFCGTDITLLGGEWTAGDGTIACADTSAPFVPHKPKEN